MNIRTLREKFIQELSGCYPETEIHSFFKLLSEHYFGLSAVKLALHPQKELNADEIEQMNSAMNRLKNNEPVQYIIGETEFCGLNFQVNKNVLIPRPETEELVEWILTDHHADKPKKMLDIGTGSGCIPVSLAKKKPFFDVFAADISEEALKVAKSNAELNEVQITFQLLDILNPRNFIEKFDLIVSNPPYVRQKEKELMQPNVLEYEPHLALFVEDEDPLLFYRKILEFAQTNLNKDGLIYFELNEYLEEELKVLFQNFGYAQVDFKKDIYGKTRMARLKKT